MGYSRVIYARRNDPPLFHNKGARIRSKKILNTVPANDVVSSHHACRHNHITTAPTWHHCSSLSTRRHGIKAFTRKAHAPSDPTGTKHQRLAWIVGPPLPHSRIYTKRPKDVKCVSGEVESYPLRFLRKMGATMEEELKKAEPEPALLAEPPLASAPNDLAEEKAVVPPPREVDVKGVDDTKALAVVESK